MKLLKNVPTLFVLFTLGIILPASVLVYLGFQSFRYEDRLLERLVDDRYAAMADSLTQAWETDLAAFRTDLTAVALQHGFSTRPPERLATVAASPPDVAGVPVRSLLVYARDGSLRLPVRRHAPNNSVPRDRGWGPFADRMRELERLEFAGGNAGAAAKGYRELLGADLSAEQRQALLKALGAAARKQGDMKGTEAAYKRLATEFEFTPDVSGLPTGVVARQLLAKAYDDFKRPALADAVRHELFDAATAWRWPMAESTRADLLNKTRGVTNATRWKESASVQNNLDGRAAMAAPFLASSARRTAEALRARGWSDDGGVVDRGDAVSVTVTLPEGSGPFAGGRLVAVLDRAAFWAHQGSFVVSRISASSATVRAQLPDGEKTWGPTPAGGQGLKRTVQAMEPPITFTLSAPPVGNTAIVLTRRRVFAGMIALSGLVMLTGLFLIFRAIRQERLSAELKAEFVANVSHELRTPLSTILYIGERLSGGRIASGQTERVYDLLNQEAGRLRTLIDDVLDFSRMMSGKTAFRTMRIDVNDIAEGARARMSEAAGAAGFDIEVALSSSPLMVVVDPSATTQAVTNLIDNAMKYSGTARRIVISTSTAGNDATLAVRDFGIGLSQKDQMRVFDRFVRVEPALERAHAGGVGLGLAMVKAIVEGQGGRVSVESKEGDGATFSVTFPLSDGSAA